MATAATGTGVVPYDSQLIRNGWMLEGLVQAASTSFWDGMTGSTYDAVIYQKTNFSAAEGHEVRFQFDGNLVSEAHVDKEQAWGNSEQKKLFSDSIRVRRLRWSVDNGDSFDAKNVGDLSIAEHGDSRAKLADLFIRAKDQFLFDAFQGRLNNEAASHVLRPNNRATVGDLVAGDSLTYDFILDMELAIKSGRGFTEGSDRRPLEPYRLADGRRVWLMVVNSAQARDLRKDDRFVSIMTGADVRGQNNRLIKGIIGQIGSFIIVEAQDFFGVSTSRVIGKTKVEIAGLRQIDSNGNFTGESGFASSGAVVADRGLILGRSAGQIGFGKMPDYKFKTSQDFDIKSESALEVWMNVQKTILKSESGDYDDAIVSGFDFGVVVFDTYNRTVA
jgi:hypothetical protein